MKASTAIWVLFVMFGFAETAYFGWNTMPVSPAEVICDGIAVLLSGVALLASAIEVRLARSAIEDEVAAAILLHALKDISPEDAARWGNFRDAGLRRRGL